MMRMWTNFAISGSPNNPVSLENVYPGLHWPEFGAGKGQYLDIEPRMSANSRGERLAARADRFWNKIVPDLQASTRGNICL
ncbi:acetylcholinesterase-like [Mya arenaria]|uniref:acetylcholinesterase-like n=1 Tax=Mya arenaria TaxID=6604 RepID=UPI0022E7F328|nr:acetylcholinesterase-like [Mya arenaria]